MVYYPHTDDNGPRCQWPSWNATTHLSITHIREPVIPKSNCSDPLVWWATRSPYSSPSARNNVNNKALIQMAQDFLSGPPVDIERTFFLHGNGGDIIEVDSGLDHDRDGDNERTM
ncbi:hypothetical protein GGX14DRAFT_404600 [Mycena pura]|uniref:Uncharacterized protein n=1 Tax=Mycena pura TaxID=153505 RepID=A0AAD6UXM8_9AGAR|nr:hypothetical protein GGX14DRAFT_404600 [Mycena pura]